MSDIAIRVDNLGKLYHLGALHQRPDTLRDALVSTFQRSNVQTFQRSNVCTLKILSRITEPTSGRAKTCGGRVGSLLVDENLSSLDAAVCGTA